MVWLLADSDAVANVVWPRASRVPVPNVVVPSLNVTVVVVLSLLTVCVSVGEVLPLTLASPPYTAVIGWLLGVNIEIVNIACPELRLTAANGVAPSLKVIVVVELALLTVIAGLVSVLELSAVSVAVTV